MVPRTASATGRCPSTRCPSRSTSRPARATDWRGKAAWVPVPLGRPSTIRCSQSTSPGAGGGARFGQRHPPDQPHHPAGFSAHRLLVVEVLTPAGTGPRTRRTSTSRNDCPSRTISRRCTPTDSAGRRRSVCRSSIPATAALTTPGRCATSMCSVPRGYHPFCAAHGYDGYYLNALAADTRSMAAEDDPDLAWTRATWDSIERDRRVPLVGEETP